MFKHLLWCALSLFPVFAQAFTGQALQVATLPATFDACIQHFPDRYIPYRARDNQSSPLFELCFDDFAVLYSGDTKTPLFSVEHVTFEKLENAKEVQRFNEFFEDFRVPKEYRSTLEDYNKSNYDRGHLAPAGNRSTSTQMAQSFAMTNVAPQAPHFNRGTWAKIEGAVRSYVRRTHHDVYIYTGVLFTLKERSETIGQNAVRVPVAFYKIVYDPDATKPRAWAYWNSNSANSKNMKPITIEEFNRRSGLKLLLNDQEKAIPDPAEIN